MTDDEIDKASVAELEEQLKKLEAEMSDIRTYFKDRDGWNKKNPIRKYAESLYPA